jgi:hypothetical protein
MTVRFSRSDDSDRLVRLYMDNDEEAIPLRDPDENEPLLTIRMIRIGDRARQRIGKCTHRLIKGYPMLLQIPAPLGRIPSEGSRHSEIL